MVIIGPNQIMYIIIEYNKERLKTSKMQETISRDKYKDTKCYDWNVTTDETTRPEQIKQLNSKQLDTFYKFNINERYGKYEMKCQELQQHK
jgi:hypothetical protein